MKPKFDSKGRSDFGIHPEGYLAGTIGCIGIKSTDRFSFLKSRKFGQLKVLK